MPSGTKQVRCESILFGKEKRMVYFGFKDFEEAYIFAIKTRRMLKEAILDSASVIVECDHSEPLFVRYEDIVASLCRSVSLFFVWDVVENNYTVTVKLDPDMPDCLAEMIASALVSRLPAKYEIRSYSTRYDSENFRIDAYIIF